MSNRGNSAAMINDGVKTIPSYIFKSPARLVKPGFNGFRTPAVFRVMPGVDPGNPRRFDVSVMDDGTPGEWFRSFPSVQYAFDKGVSFVLQEDYDDIGWPQHSPYMIVRRALLSLAKNPSTPMYVSNLVNGKKAPFPDCKIQGAVVAMTYHKEDQDWQPRADQLDILAISHGVSRLVLDMVGTQWSMSNNDFDISAPDKGAFIVLWNKEEVIEPPGIDKTMIKYQAGSFGYGVAISPVFPKIGSMYDTIGATLSDQDVAAYKGVMRPWERIIDYRSYDDQAAIMCEFAPAGPLVYAWGDVHPEWLTNSVKLRANNEPRIGGPAPVQGYSTQPRYDDYNAPQPRQQRNMYQPPQQQEEPIRPRMGAGRPAPEPEEEEAPWDGPDAPIEEMASPMTPREAHRRAVVRAMSAMDKSGSDDPM